MNLRYPAMLVLTSLLLGAAATVPIRRPPPDVRTLYSPRALRRARIILQLKLLELRKERLERIRRAIEQGLPLDSILKTGLTLTQR